MTAVAKKERELCLVQEKGGGSIRVLTKEEARQIDDPHASKLIRLSPEEQKWVDELSEEGFRMLIQMLSQAYNSSDPQGKEWTLGHHFDPNE